MVSKRMAYQNFLEQNYVALLTEILLLFNEVY